MASRFQYSILMSMAWLLAMPVHAESNEEGATLSAGEQPVLDPRVERRRVKESDIDSENVEVGVFTGLYSSADFGTNPYYSLRVAYHVSEDLFVEGAFSHTRLGETSFERLTPGVELLSDDQRDLDYYSASVGYNILPGESFLGRQRAFNNTLYIIAGAGSTDFADDSRFTINAGLGYRLLLNDWLSLRMEVRDYLYETDVLGEVDTTQNLEWGFGLSTFF